MLGLLPAQALRVCSRLANPLRATSAFSIPLTTRCAAILLAFSVFFPLIAAIPRVVLSAVIMVVAIQHFDPWTTQMLRRVTSTAARQRRLIVVELLVVLVVAVLSITVNIVLAVFIGIAIAVLLFVVRMSRSNIRRTFRCDGVHSRKSRTAKEMEVLEHRGGTILAMELEGALFFGPRDIAAIKLLASLGRELSGRLRRANRTIHQLEV